MSRTEFYCRKPTPDFLKSLIQTMSTMGSPATSSLTVSSLTEQEVEEEVKKIRDELDSLRNSGSEDDQEFQSQFDALKAEYDEVLNTLKQAAARREETQEEKRRMKRKLEEESVRLGEEIAKAKKVLEEQESQYKEYEASFPDLALFRDAFMGLHSKRKEYEKLMKVLKEASQVSTPN